MTKELSGSPGHAGGLRKGFTTGTCAAAAARGAAEALTSGVFPSWVTVSLPGGQDLTLPLMECSFTEKGARCAVRKDSGDDPDITNGMLIFAEAGFAPAPGVSISGGPGIGRVTRKGLPVPPGHWAINPGPMRMIEAALEGLDLKGRGVEIVLSAPEGEERAKKTWNPRLGIEGGISILGTTGIVEPKSEAAYLASIDLYIAAALAFDSQRPGAVFLVPGYVGEKCLLERFGAPRELMVSMGDHAGHALEKSAEKGARAIFLFAHASKGAKIAAGLFNTHCRTGDARLETLAACAGAAGATKEQIAKLLSLPLAEEAVSLLRKWGLASAFDIAAERAHWRCSLLLGGAVPLGVALLSLEGEVVGSFPRIGEEVRSWKKLPSSA